MPKSLVILQRPIPSARAGCVGTHENILRKRRSRNGSSMKPIAKMPRFLWNFVFRGSGLTTPDYVRAHSHSMHNRDEILSGEQCGCFYCGAIFPPMEVRDWTDEREDVGQTALCPRCGIDAVIGSNSSYPITTEFLETMKTHWFQTDRINGKD